MVNHQELGGSQELDRDKIRSHEINELLVL
jgi:hypothetical protein